MARARGMMLYRHDQVRMRQHLLNCFKKELLSPFPVLDQKPSRCRLKRFIKHIWYGDANYPKWVPNILRYLEWGCKISWDAKYPLTPAFNRGPAFISCTSVLTPSVY